MITLKSHRRHPTRVAASALTALPVATTGPAAATSPALAAGSRVKVDQVAYVPGAPKRATVVSASSAVREGVGALPLH